MKKFIPNLSPLESDVLKILWKKKYSRVRDIHSTLKKKRKVALTSVAVTLDRLYKKGLVKREIKSGRGGFHYIYTPTYSEEGFKMSIIDKTVEQLIKSFGSTAITYFNEKLPKKRLKK